MKKRRRVRRQGEGTRMRGKSGRWRMRRRMKVRDAWSRTLVLSGSRRKTADGSAEQVITCSPEVQRCSSSRVW